MEDHVVLEKKSIWQEATDLGNRITSEKVKQSQAQAVRQYQENIVMKLI